MFLSVSPSLPGAEGAGVVLAGLQPHTDAVSVDGVAAAQGVPALWVHVVLAHQAGLQRPGSLTPVCRSLRGGCRPLDGARGCGPADGPRGRPLVLHQLEAHLLDDLFHGHAGQRAAGALHLLEQRRQLSPVALWVASPKLLEDLVEFTGRGGGGSGAGGRRRWNCRMDRLNGRGRRETGRGGHPHLSSDVGLEVRRGQVDRLVHGWEGRLELVWVRGWGVVVAVAELGMGRKLERLLVKVWVSLGREGSNHWDWRRRGHELGADQGLHHLVKSQVSHRDLGQ